MFIFSCDLKVKSLTMVKDGKASTPDGACCCRSGLGRKFKKVFCREDPSEASFDSVSEGAKIENSAPEYGLKYEHALEEPLAAGTLILVTATPSEDIPRFAINVGSGDSWSERCDIALHLNPRLPQRYVVRNHRHRGAWGAEETTSFRSFPFKPGREFTVQLLVADGEWLIAVDDEHYCSFAHRTPAVSATWVQVTDISDPLVKVVRAQVYPILAPEPLEVPHCASEQAAAGDGDRKWSCNMYGKLPRGLQQGEQLVIYGRVRALPHSFHVDLTDGWHEWPHPAVHLHANPRLCSAATRSRQLVVFNSWSDGAWGGEIRQATARIIGGSHIRLRLVRGGCEWSVWADDVLLGELPFRLPPDNVRAMRLRGDLQPLSVYTAPAE